MEALNCSRANYCPSPFSRQQTTKHNLSVLQRQPPSQAYAEVQVWGVDGTEMRDEEEENTWEIHVDVSRRLCSRTEGVWVVYLGRIR